MSQIVKCPDCGKPVAARFPMHDCRQRPQVDQGPEVAQLRREIERAGITVDRKRAELAEAEAELRKARAALSAYWRARGAKG